MSQILGNRAVFQPLQSINAASFTGSYQALGSPLTAPAVLVKIVNNSTVLVTVSYDGVNDHDIYPTLSGSVYDFGSDAQTANHGDKRLMLPQGTQIWVKSGAGTGFVYLVAVSQGWP